MLVEVNETNLNLLYDYLQKDKVRNIYFYSDISAFGLHSAFQKVWYLEENGVIRAAFLKYYENIMIYSQNQDYDRSYVDKLFVEYNIKNANMSYEDYVYLKDIFANSIVNICTMCTMDNISNTINSEKVVRAIPSDASKIIESISTIEEFASFASGSFDEKVAKREAGIRTDFQRTFFIEEKGKVISHASTSCMSTNASVVAGVFTLEGYRHKGYAKSVVGTLCNSLISDGKTPLLYFTNPIAGEMYHKLGFKDMDQWVIIHYIK